MYNIFKLKMVTCEPWAWIEDRIRREKRKYEYKELEGMDWITMAAVKIYATIKENEHSKYLEDEE